MKKIFAITIFLAACTNHLSSNDLPLIRSDMKNVSIGLNVSPDKVNPEAVKDIFARNSITFLDAKKVSVVDDAILSAARNAGYGRTGKSSVQNLEITRVFCHNLFPYMAIYWTTFDKKAGTLAIVSHGDLSARPGCAVQEKH